MQIHRKLTPLIPALGSLVSRTGPKAQKEKKKNKKQKTCLEKQNKRKKEKEKEMM